MRVLCSRLVLACGVLLPVFWPSVPAVAGEAPEPEPTQEEVASHHAKGEARFEGQWVPISQLLSACAEARKAAKPDIEKKEAAGARVAKINKTVAEMLKEHRSEKTPLEREKAQAQVKRSEALRALSIRPPAKPNKIRVSGGKKNSGSRRQLERQNREREQEYQRALERYKEIRSQATKAIKEAEATITRCDKKLDNLYAAFKANQKPLLTERTEVTQAMRDAERRVGMLRAKVLRIAVALVEVPEKTRIRYGAVEWKSEFYTLKELSALHAAMTGDIHADRQRLAQDLAEKGRSLPKTWQHPKQREANALKARIAGAEADMEKARKS